MSPNVDVSWLLVAGERILGGERLHSDIIETNPPFSIWLYMPLLVGEAATGIRAETLLAYGLPLLALGSVLLSGSTLRKAGWFADARSVWLMPVMVFILSWAFPGDFGQREQIAVIALLPWLALLAARSTSDEFVAGNQLQIVVAGVGAAVFVMIKPPMAALSMVLPAVWLALVLRSWKPVLAPETLLAAAITLFYLGWIVAFHQAFLTTLMPMLVAYYLPVRVSAIEVAKDPVVAIFAMNFIATWILALPRSVDRAALVLLLAAAGYLPGFLLMGKGWPYQAAPFLMFSLLAVLVQLWRSLSESAMTLLRYIVVLMILAQAHFLWDASLHSQSPPASEHVAEIKRIAGPNPTVVSIAARLQPAHPLTRLIGGRYLSQTPAMWLANNAELLATIESDAEKRETLLARRDGEIARSAESIARLKPDLVIAGGAKPEAAEHAIMADPAMVSALGAYRLLYATDGSTVFVRKDLPARN